MTDLQDILLPYLQHYGGYAGLIAFFASLFETLLGFGYFLPGSTIVLLMGLFAGQGVIDIKVVLLFAFLGAVAGDQGNYFLGRRYARSITGISWLHLSDETLQKARKFLDDHGSVSILFGRLLPGVKESISFVAGSLKMRYGEFLFWEILGALAWSVEFVGIGYLFSNSLSLAQLWLSRSVYLLVALAFFFGCLYLFVFFLKQKGPTALAITKTLGRSFLSHPATAHWIAQHPKSVSFVKRRTNKSTFWGLPLSLFVLVFLYVLMLFAGSVEDFISQDPIVAVDHIIANTVLTLRMPIWTDFFTFVTLLGRPEVVSVFLLMVGGILWVWGRARYFLPLLVSVVGSGVFMYVSKWAFHRPRPDVALYYESTYSFPSGHATVAVALYGFTAYLLIHFSKDFSRKLNVFFAATVLILLIGMSRLYLGEHYLSDVYSGYLIGTLWWMVGVVLTQWLDHRSGTPLDKPWRFARIFTLASVVAFVLFYSASPQWFRYRKNPKKETQDIIVTTAEASLSSQRHFTRSLTGIETWPVNLILIDRSLQDLKKHLKEADWHPMEKGLKNALPIYWNYKKANLFRVAHSHHKTYLLKIWRTHFLLPTHERIFVATVVEREGYIWQIAPRFAEDIDTARTFVTAGLQKADVVATTRMFACNKALIGQDIIGQNYFTDGWCSLVYMKGNNNE